MKKKTFGRIAALGLAGLTAVPAISIVASADVTRTDKPDDDGFYSLTGGPAYKVTWNVTETTYTYTYDKSNTSKGYSATSAVVTVDPDKTSELKGTKYFATKNAADAFAASCNVSKNSTWSANNTTVNNDLSAFSQKCLDYAWYENNNKEATQTVSSVYTVKSNYLNSSLTVGDTIQFYKDDENPYGLYKVATVDGKKTYTSLGQPLNSVPDAIENVKYYTNVSTVSAVQISLSQIMSETNSSFAEKSAYNTSNEIVPYTGTTPATPSSDSYYKLAKSSTGGTGTNTGTGTYGQYEIPSVYRYATNVSYYSVETDTWYPNQYSFYYAVGYYPTSSYSGYWSSKTPTYKYSSSRRWFDPVDGNYYTATGGSAYTVLVSSNSDTEYTENYVYKSSTTGLYYLTWTAANNATSSNGTVTAIRAIPTYAAYFSMTTGQFYTTYAAAYSASGNNTSRVISVNGASSTVTGLDYLDPFYYYYMTGTRLPSSTTSTDTSSVKIGNRTGWTAVASSAKAAKSGTSLNVSMNGETVVPSSVLTSIKGRNVTVNFTLKNGVVYSINGNDVTSAKDIDIDTVYNTKNIPTKLVSKAKSVNDGVSTSQLSIEGSSFGSSADVTVKFATKRAGCTARLYRYNSDRNSLSLVAKSTVASSGKCTFDGVTKGGDYVVVLTD